MFGGLAACFFRGLGRHWPGDFHRPDQRFRVLWTNILAVSIHKADHRFAIMAIVQLHVLSFVNHNRLGRSVNGGQGYPLQVGIEGVADRSLRIQRR